MRTRMLICLYVFILLTGCGSTDGMNTELHETEKGDTIYTDPDDDSILGASELETAGYEESRLDVQEERYEVIEENQEISLGIMDEHYYVIDVIGKNRGDVIHVGEKFWVLAGYSESESIWDAQLYYVCTDSKLNIYEKVSYEVFGGNRAEDYISEDVFLIFCPGGTNRYYLADLEGNNVNSRFMNDNEKVLGMYKDDSGINIFTAYTEETISSQNIVFNVYDEYKNVKLNFSKDELETMYSAALHLNYNELEIYQCGENDYLIRNMNQDRRTVDLFVDTVRCKAFVTSYPTSVMGCQGSNGTQIVSSCCVVDIENETVQCFAGLFFNNCSVKANSRLSNNTFLFDANGYYALIDIYGNLISDLVRENTKTTYFTDFYDGYMLVEYENEGGTTFLTVINSNGEWQFEPMQGTIKYIKEYIEETGQFIAFDNSRINTLLIDRNGKIEVLEGVGGGKDFVILENEGEKEYLVWNVNGSGEPEPFRIIQAH